MGHFGEIWVADPVWVVLPNTAHYKFLPVATVSMLKIDHITRGELKTSPLKATPHAQLVCQSYITDSRLFTKGFRKCFLNAKVKCLMLKCINHVQSDSHSQCSRPCCTLGYLGCCLVTQMLHSKESNRMVTHLKQSCHYNSHQYISQRQF